MLPANRTAARPAAPMRTTIPNPISSSHGSHPAPPRPTHQSPAMTDENTLTSDETIDQEIVAYLDGELDPAAAARVERRMAEDPRYNARLNQLEKTWDLLDSLGPTEADDSFTQSTV